jgi:hypothetical protein
LTYGCISWSFQRFNMAEFKGTSDGTLGGKRA